MRRREMVHRGLAVLVLLCLAIAVPTAAERAVEVDSEAWYTYTLDGAAIGWRYEVVRKTEEHYRTTQTTVLRISRAGHIIETTSRSSYVEEHDGNPVRMALEEVEGDVSIAQVWDFTGPYVTHSITQFGRTRTSEHPHPEGDWFMAERRARHVREQIQAGLEEFSYRMIRTEFGLTPVTVTERRVGSTTFEHDGEKIQVSIWDQHVEHLPVVFTQYFTWEGVLVYGRTVTGMGVMEVARTDRATALEAARGSPPELMAGMMVIPDRKIEDATDTVLVRLRLRVRDGEMPKLPEAGGQRIEAHGEDWTVTVFEPSAPLPAEDRDPDDRAYLAPSALVDFEDPAVSRLVEETTPEEPVTERQMAEQLSTFVHDYITVKDLDVGFGTASSVARERRGDCTEHAVLLIALLRGHGIPARAATGLMYLDDPASGTFLFGWHMWVQALIDGHWVDLEPSWPEGLPHAAYVLMSVSSMADRDDPAELAILLQLMGNLEIEIVEVEHEI